MRQKKTRKKSKILEWNETKQKYPSDNLIQLFEKQTAKTPTKTACVYENISITYDELNKKANQLALYIKKQKLSPESTIAVYFGRSTELLIAYLAVMKLGYTYIPIDQEISKTQLKNIIEDARVELILTTDSYLKNVCEATHNTSIKTIVINQKTGEIELERNTNLAPFASSKIAYILYTSGTTGKPKGIKISHKSIVNLLFAMVKEVGFNQNDICLGITPFSFDLSVPDIYLPLINGATLILANPDTRFKPNEIIQMINQYQITFMQATPITWQMLIESGWKNETNIKIISGGDGLPVTLAKKLIITSDHVWNFYGPTETTVWSTCHKVINVDETKPYIPIGKPLSNTQVYVLDEQLQLLPAETIGELYIGGDGVASGYLNRPDLNEKSFISDLFGDNKEAKLYKTNDLVIQSSNGELHYIGRSDNQLKIRGYRIEPSAIEKILMACPDIEESIVLDRNLEHKHELVAYLILKKESISIGSIRAYLKEHLPAYMIPSRFVSVSQFPLTPNGKINRKMIPNLTDNHYLAESVSQIGIAQNEVEEIILESVCDLLKRNDVHPESNFFEIGLHSILLVELASTFTTKFNHNVSAIDLFEHPNIRAIANFLMGTRKTESKGVLTRSSAKQRSDHAIAVIGMSCRFPGADDSQEFWQLIINQQEAIRFFSEEELISAGVPKKLIENPDYVPARGIMNHIDKFDASFFGYSPYEASMTDPQHRVFLEQSWMALEDAGYVPENFDGKIGVFAGMNDSSYLVNQLLKNQKVLADYDFQQIMLATGTHYLSTKVAYALGLKGPGITVNTACSTGLTSIALACDSLVQHHCDMALAGAITIMTPQETGYLYRELGILSPNGRCFVFDKNAQGTVLSNGCGIVVLKRLSDAIRENDNILAVVKGWAINNDGRDKAGFTAPSVNGQTSCIKEAVLHANILPTEIGYVEAHGTGTLLGDPIEVTSLAKGYGYETYKKSQYCAIGSVKANIGHTDSAAGVAGFIKCVLALNEKILPPNINYSDENPKINFSQSPFFVNDKLRPWETNQENRVAAVNALGFGGTNAHVILQEAPTVKSTSSKQGNVFIVSAKTEDSLKKITAQMYQHILKLSKSEHAEHALADAAYTLQIGRQHFNYRTAIAYVTFDDLLESLANRKPIHLDKVKKTNKRIIFGFVGQGAQYALMAKEIYREHPYFKELIDQCCNYLQNETQIDLRTLLFPKANYQREANQKLSKTEYAQPALFIIEYALAKLLISLGIMPTAMIGHSIGEYVAATISGVLHLEEALKLISVRAKLMAKTAPGAMLAIPLSKEKIKPFLNENVELAAHNAPKLCIVSGLREHLIQFETSIQGLLNEENLSCQFLHTSHAFHSKHMDEILAEFTQVNKQTKSPTFTIPYLSNVTGDWITTNDFASTDYWTGHIRNPVLFSEGIEQLKLEASDIFIEVGPGHTLGQLVRQHTREPTVLNTLPHYKNMDENSYTCFLNVIAKLWLMGKDIDWSKLYTQEIRKRTSLPTYVFERTRHWIEADKLATISSIQPCTNELLYTPVWEREKKLSTLFNNPTGKTKAWLILGNKEAQNAFRKKLGNQSVYGVSSGAKFKQTNSHSFVIDFGNKEHFLKLFKKLNHFFDDLVVVNTLLTETKKHHFDPEFYLERGTYSLLYLSQVFSEIYPSKKLSVLVVTKNLYSVLGDEEILPVKSSALGPCKVIPQEEKNFAFKLIDIEHGTKFDSKTIECLCWEANHISSSCFKDEIAHRGDYRWMRHLKPCTAFIESNRKERLKKRGVYLLTGGLGGMGLELAEYLAKKYNAHVILMTRSEIPLEEWDNLLKKKNLNEKRINQIKKLQTIKKHAASLTCKVAPLENKALLTKTIRSIQKQYGCINGVIHAAGVAGGGIAQFKTKEEFHRVLQPKLFGTQYLIELLRKEPLDFFVFVSSITAITGFPGQVDYCSANRILDSYALAAETYFEYPVFCTTMNWQAWRDVGMAANSKTLLVELDESNSTAPKEGCILFEKIINADLNQVIISNTDLNFYQIPKSSLDNNDTKKTERECFENTDITKRLKKIFCEILGLSEVNLDDDFYELGGHSLLAINLLSKIRTIFKINIPSATLFKFKTVRELETIIQSSLKEQVALSPLVTLKQGSKSNLSLFLIHPVGGTVFCYQVLAKALPDDYTVYALQDPSIEHQRTLFKTIEEMATFYRKIIQETQPHGPYYLCGASFGASVVHEIAYQLLEANEEVRFAGLIDGWGKFSKTKFDIDYVREILCLYQPTKQSVVLEDQNIWEQLLKHRLDMMLDYQHKKISIKLTLFKAKELLPEYQEGDTKDNYWGDYSTLPVEIFAIPGDHNTMLQNENALVLANYIKDLLKDSRC